MTDSVLPGYRPLTCGTPPGYPLSRLALSCEPGRSSEEWKVSEIGDGNLGVVFIVEGTHKTIIVK